MIESDIIDKLLGERDRLRVRAGAQAMTDYDALCARLREYTRPFGFPRCVEEAADAIAALEAALREIAALDPEKDSHMGGNEWGEAECFGKAQDIARAAIAPAPAPEGE